MARSSYMQRRAGIEEFQANGGLVEGGVVDSDAGERAEILEVQAELTEIKEEIEGIRADVDEQDEALEELEENIEGMESMMKSGGYNAIAFANSFKRARELNIILGGKNVARIGAESLGSIASAEMMARQGVEGFVDTIKGYAKKAVEFIKSIFNAIINFFVGLWNGLEKTTRRATQLKERVNKAEKLKEKISLGGWNAFFDYEKKGLTYSMAGWQGTNKAIGNLMKTGTGSPDSIAVASFNSAYSELAAAIVKDTKEEATAGEKKEGDKKVLVGTANGTSIHAEMKDGTPKDLKEAAEFLRSIRLYFGTTEAGKKLSSGETAAKLDKAALLKVITSVEGAVSSQRQGKVDQEFTEAKRNHLVGTLNAMTSGDEKKATENNEKIALIRQVTATASSLARSVNDWQMKCVNWALDGVAAHV